VTTKRDLFEHQYNSDTFEAILTDRHVHFRIDEPWSGSTETGFGHETNFDLPREEAIELARKILDFYEKVC
jgi:hypothetical protein